MRRDRFVWLPDQPVDHAPGFTTLRGTRVNRDDEGTNRWVTARGVFNVAESADTRLSITVDGRYRLWLNGVPLGRGPVRASPHFQAFDIYEIEPRLRHGRNVIAVLVHVPGVDLAWYERMRGAWQPVFGDGGLAVDLTTAAAAGPDPAWRIRESEAWQRNTPRRGWGQDFIESFDARLLDPRWIDPDFDDSGWPVAVPMVSEPPPDQRARGWGRVTPFPVLLPAEVPAAYEKEIAPDQLVWVRSASVPDADDLLGLYSADLGPIDTTLVGDVEQLLAGGTALVRTSGDDAVTLMFAFDQYHAGRPFLEIDAAGGEIIDIAVAEAIPGEFGRGEAGDGLRHEGHLGCAQVARYTARPGPQRFERFDWTAVRAMQLVIRSAPQGLRIRRIGSVATHYPVAAEGSFVCSDPRLDALWSVARTTVRNCMHDSWVDCPGREARQWVGDPIVMFDVAALGFGPSVFPLHRQFLRHMAESQRQDGLLRMVAPGDFGPDALTIPDFSLLWIIGVERYWLASGDLNPVEVAMAAIERVLGWFDRVAGPDGLLADVPQWHFIEWADIDRRGQSAPINLLYAGALAVAARLASVAERPRPAALWSARSDKIAAAINDRFWNERRGLYVDSVDPATGRQRERASQHGNALALLFDVAPVTRRSRVLSALTDRTRLQTTAAPPIVINAEPFDDSCDLVRANSFFSHFVLDAIARAGRFEWVVEELRRAFLPMLDAGATTLWESFSPTASLCHGFSSTPLYLLSRFALGVEALTPGFATFRVRPQAGGLTSAAGSTPTPHGPIHVSWRRNGDVLHAEIRFPPECLLVSGDTRDLIKETRSDGVTHLTFKS